MSDEIRNVTTITFSDPRFDETGLKLDVLSELLAYRSVLIETAKMLWRLSGSPDVELFSKGFEDSFRLESFSIESGKAIVPIRRVVRRELLTLRDAPYPIDEIEDAAYLIDLTIAAVSADRPIPNRMPMSVLPLLAAMGHSLRTGESIKTQSIRSNSPAELTLETRMRIEHLVATMNEQAAGPAATPEHGYDSALPLWQSVIELGASLPPEEWDRVPSDLASKMDHYLYHTIIEHE